MTTYKLQIAAGLSTLHWEYDTTHASDALALDFAKGVVKEDKFFGNGAELYVWRLGKEPGDAKLIGRLCRAKPDVEERSIT